MIDNDWDRKPKNIKKKWLSDDTRYTIIQVFIIVVILPALIYLNIMWDTWYFNWISGG